MQINYARYPWAVLLLPMGRTESGLYMHLTKNRHRRFFLCKRRVIYWHKYYIQNLFRFIIQLWGWLLQPRYRRTGAIVIIGYVCIAVDTGQASLTKITNFAGPDCWDDGVVCDGQEPIKCGDGCLLWNI